MFLDLVTQDSNITFRGILSTAEFCRRTHLWFRRPRRMGAKSSCRRRRHLDSRTEAAVWTGESSRHRNQSWDDNPDLSGLKIARDLVRAFLMQILLIVLPPNFTNSRGENKYDVSGYFCLVICSSLTASVTQFVSVIDRVLSSYA
jgi:hypothetical protein